MELASVASQSCCSLSFTALSSSLAPLQPRSPSLVWFRFSAPNLNFSSDSKGCFLPVIPIRRQNRHLAAVSGSSATEVSKNEGGTSVVGDSPSSRDFENDKEEEEEEEEEEGKMLRVCDKLIGVFLVDMPTPTDWRRLLAFSRTWDNIRPHFFKRCEDRAESEQDPEMKHKLLRFARKLKEIDEDVQRHNELLNVIRKAPSELNEVVARRRKDFTEEFFVHLHTVAQSYQDDPTEKNALAKLGKDCVAAVQAYDTRTESVESLKAAELKLQDIINSPSLEAACKKIDNLAAKNQFDSSLVLMITKAWSDAKESNMMKDEAKDILYHLYKITVGNLQRQVPKDIRILKYLIQIKDRDELLCALNDAFTPGLELEGNDADSLYTTPEKIYTWSKAVVDAYHSSKEGTLIREARDLMNPKIIEKMEELNKLVKDKFM